MSGRTFPTYLECAEHLAAGGVVRSALGTTTTYSEQEFRELAAKYPGRRLRLFTLEPPS